MCLLQLLGVERRARGTSGRPLRADLAALVAVPALPVARSHRRQDLRPVCASVHAVLCCVCGLQLFRLRKMFLSHL